MTVANGLYSSALNTQNIHTKVNDRTGQFLSTIKIDEISCGLQAPASFELSFVIGPNFILNESMYADNWNACFNIPVPFFKINDLLGPTHFTLDGNTYPIEKIGTTDNYEIQYRRVDDIIIKKRVCDTTNINMEVTYKDGTVDIFNAEGALARRISPLGHTLFFEHYTTTIPNFFKKVRDNYGNSIEVVFVSGSPESYYEIISIKYGETTKRRLYTGTRTTSTGKEISVIEKVSLQDDFTKFVNFDYIEKENSICLKSVVTPFGESRSVDYMTLNCGAAGTIPAVSRLTICDKDKADSLSAADYVRVEFTYSTNNFTGYGGTGWQYEEDLDNCMELAGDYFYDVTENYKFYTAGAEQANQSYSTKRTFNKFHLITAEELKYTATPDNSIKKRYTYPSETGNIYAQPANFCFCTREERVYKQGNAERTETEERTFDNSGNMTYQKQDNGITTTYEYLNTTTIPHLVKKEKKHYVTSATPPVDYNISKIEYIEIEGYPYSVDWSTGQITPKAYLKSKVTSAIDENNTSTDKVVESNTYQVQSGVSDNRLLGVQIREDTQGNGGAVSETWEHRIFETKKLEVKNYKQIPGDTTKILMATTISDMRISETISATNADGNTARYEFNSYGLLTRKTSNAGTNYEYYENNTYQYWTRVGDKSYNMATYEVNYPNLYTEKFFYYLDRNLKIVKVEVERLVGGTATKKVLKEVSYNQDGTVESNIGYDYYTEDGENKTITQTTQYQYTAGELTEITYPDSTHEYISHDKVARKKTIKKDNEITQDIYYNKFGKEDHVTIKSKVENKEYTSNSVYNNYGQLTKSTDFMGKSINYEYDRYSRLTKKTAEVDGTNTDIETYEYPTYVVNSEKMIKVTTNGIGDYTRTFDNLGRITSEIASGEQKSWEYSEKKDILPSAFNRNTNGSNDGSVDYEYEDKVMLPSKTTIKTPGLGNITHDMTYFKDLELKSYRSDYSTFYSQLLFDMNITRNEEEKTRELTYKFKEVDYRCIKKHYSEAEERLSKVEYPYMSVSVNNFYDASTGKVKEISYSEGLDLEFTIAYSSGGDTVYGKGSIQSIRVTSASFKINTEILFEYDEYGRESKRTHASYQGQSPSFSDSKEFRSKFTPSSLISEEKYNENGDEGIHQYTYSKDSKLTQSQLGDDSATYTLKNNFLFDEVASITDNTNSTETYKYTGDTDVVDTYALDSETPFKFIYDKFGNVTKDYEKNKITYNSFNQPTKIEKDGVAYTYCYSASKELLAIFNTNDNSMILNLYDEDGSSIGEVLFDNAATGSVTSKTLRIMVGDILIGRLIVPTSGSKSVEMYVTETDGTVRETICYSSQGVTQKHRYQYNDYGEITQTVSLTKLPTKTTYSASQQVDLSGMEAIVTKGDDTSKIAIQSLIPYPNVVSQDTKRIICKDFEGSFIIAFDITVT